jgi:3-oxoacyl-[acyl-carrier protein] reductase
VTVNAIAPGPVMTDLLAESPQEILDYLAGMSPLERLGQPADVVEAVAFLAGPARWVNGQVIYVNGGVA